MSTKLLSREEVAERIRRLPPEKQTAAAALALKLYGPAPKKTEAVNKRFLNYQYDPVGYVKKFLNWEPWQGIDAKHPGQVEILDACALAVRQQYERREYQNGNLKLEELTVWKPDDPIKNWIRVESGNGVGKTKMISGFVNWGFDCFNSIVYTFHLSATQDEVTTWKEIGRDRRNKGLPGRPLTTKIHLSADRFAISRNPSNAGGTGEENTKGQHNEFLFFVIDEADGAKDFIFDGIETMESGGIAVVLMTANPRSRSSRFHRIKRQSYVKSLRISSLYHPNVVEGKEKIHGAVTRGFIQKQLEKHKCTAVEKHDPKLFTFKLDFEVVVRDVKYPAGTIWQPTAGFMTTVLGICPPNAHDKTVISQGIYEEACNRVPQGGDVTQARVGVDGARSGVDKGTIYIRWQDAVWRAAELDDSPTEVYIDEIKKPCLLLKEKGVTSLHIRVDSAYGSGVIDGLRIDADLQEAFADFQVFEVHFGSSASNQRDYDNIITELYFETAETLESVCILNPPETLEVDLTEREYDWINRAGKTRKILEQKKVFKKRTGGRSPDDGDGLVLAVGPDYCFNNVNISVINVSGTGGTLKTITAADDLANILGL